MEVIVNLSSLSDGELQKIIGEDLYPPVVRNQAAMLADLKAEGWEPLPDLDLASVWTVVFDSIDPVQV